MQEEIMKERKTRVSQGRYFNNRFFILFHPQKPFTLTAVVILIPINRYIPSRPREIKLRIRTE